jgi:C-terminal binding protein
MAGRAQVVVADFIVDSLDHERRVLGDVAEPVSLQARHEEELFGRVEDADALMLYHTISLTERTIGRLSKCKLIVRCGVGYDNVDLAAARRHGIPVANVPDYGTEEVADTAIALALSLARGTHLLAGRLREGRGPWTYAHSRPLHRLRGLVFGVVGLGRIGTAAALRAKALGMDVLFYDPYVPDGRDRALGLRRAETLAELLGQSYIVSLHCPLTTETRHLIDARTLEQMRAGSYLVNTSRGGVVDVLAVLDAVTRGHLTGAAIDVLEHEPPPDDHPLLVAWRDAAPSRPRPHHPHAARCLLLRGRTARHAHQGGGELPPRAARSAGAQRGQRASRPRLRR